MKDNNFLLYAMIRQKGYNIKSLANKIGMSQMTLYLRLEGKRHFKLQELKKIATALELTGDQIKEIFFSH